MSYFLYMKDEEAKTLKLALELDRETLINKKKTEEGLDKSEKEDLKNLESILDKLIDA